jgi:hypothetical protein
MPDSGGSQNSGNLVKERAPVEESFEIQLAPKAGRPKKTRAVNALVKRVMAAMKNGNSNAIAEDESQYVSA